MRKNEILKILQDLGNEKWVMNHALCQIGIGYPEFTDRCINIGETLGVCRDWKVVNGCISAYAQNWIVAGIAKIKK